MLNIVAPNITSKWFEGSNYVQIIEMFVENTDDKEYVTSGNGLQISIKSSSLDTVVPGTLKRLAPKQSAIVQVGVRNKRGVKPGTVCSAEIVPEYRGRHSAGNSAKVSGSCGIGDFEESVQSVQSHTNPDWFNDAKYGIFIHWGVYAAPAYGNVGDKENYAEWYVDFGVAWLNPIADALGDDANVAIEGTGIGCTEKATRRRRTNTIWRRMAKTSIMTISFPTLPTKSLTPKRGLICSPMQERSTLSRRRVS